MIVQEGMRGHCPRAWELTRIKGGRWLVGHAKAWGAQQMAVREGERPRFGPRGPVVRGWPSKAGSGLLFRSAMGPAIGFGP